MVFLLHRPLLKEPRVAPTAAARQQHHGRAARDGAPGPRVRRARRVVAGRRPRPPRRAPPAHPRRGRRARRGGGAERDARACAPAAGMRQRAVGAAQQRRLRLQRRDVHARVRRGLRARRRHVLQLLPAGLRGTGLRRGRVQPGLVVHAHARALHRAVPPVWRRGLRVQLHLPDAPAGGVRVLHVRLCARVQRGRLGHGGSVELRRGASVAGANGQRHGQRLAERRAHGLV